MNYNNHMKKHAAHENFSCMKCDQKFAVRKSLIKHQRHPCAATEKFTCKVRKYWFALCVNTLNCLFGVPVSCPEAPFAQDAEHLARKHANFRVLCELGPHHVSRCAVLRCLCEPEQRKAVALAQILMQPVWVERNSECE